MTCVHVSTALRPVDSDLCLGIPPNTTQLCQISCPVECEVSAWSAWGPCTFENCQDQTAKKGTHTHTHTRVHARVHIHTQRLGSSVFTLLTVLDDDRDWLEKVAFFSQARISSSC